MTTAAWIERELVGVTLTVESTGAARSYVVDSPRRPARNFVCWTTAERAFNEEVFAVLGGQPYQNTPH